MSEKMLSLEELSRELQMHRDRVKRYLIDERVYPDAWADCGRSRIRLFKQSRVAEIRAGIAEYESLHARKLRNDAAVANCRNAGKVIADLVVAGKAAIEDDKDGNITGVVRRCDKGVYAND